MNKKAPRYVGIKQLAKEFAITIPKARKALQKAGVMTVDGQPVKPEFAQERFMDDGLRWFGWNEKIAFKAFIKAGHAKPGELEEYSHVQGKYQANSWIDDAFAKMGEIAGLDSAYENNPEKVARSYGIYRGALVSDNHAIGGPVAVLMINGQDACVRFINRLHSVLNEYETCCKSVSTNAKQIERIEFYAEAIRRVGAWVQLQFFR
jgi:hypothetical protein